MKKILVVTNILLLIVIIFLVSYKNKSTGTRFVSSACQSVECMGSAGSMKGRISAKTAEEMSQNYQRDSSKNYIWSAAGERTAVEDARSIWFSLETLKSFIWEIESAACRNKCRDTLGIRIYYARYPANLVNHPDFVGLDPSYANRHTVFMVPTFWDGAIGQYIDFNPAGGCRTAFAPGDSTKQAVIFMPATTTEDGSVQNHGGLAPPPSTTTAGTFPTTTSSF